MPEIAENLSKQRLLSVRRDATRGAKLWLELVVAADNENPDQCRTIWADIRSVSIDVFKTLEHFIPEKTNG